MDNQLGLNDEALESCVASCVGAGDALANPAAAAAPGLSGVTDLGNRVAEFMAALAIACGVLGDAAEAIGVSANACKQASDSMDRQAALAAAGGTGR